ncbi:cysteine hydrolase family protein [Streptomyces xanthophaeus]|uniref:hypothetical protein n=1 Tax=Streptomyces xanthophaeus TaxID=67385 RepID=UPI00364CCB33
MHCQPRGLPRATPVVRVRHSDGDLERDSEPWQYVPELARQDSELEAPLAEQK